MGQTCFNQKWGASFIWLIHCTKSVRIWSFLVRIFPHSDWRRRDTKYLSVFCPNAGKYRPGKLKIRTLFTKWYLFTGGSDQDLFCFCFNLFNSSKVIHSSNGDQLEDVEVKYILLFSSFEVMPQMLKRRTYFSTYSKSSLQFILILPHSTVPLVFLPKTRIQWNKAKSWLKYMNKSRIDS